MFHFNPLLNSIYISVAYITTVILLIYNVSVSQSGSTEPLKLSQKFSDTKLLPIS